MEQQFHPMSEERKPVEAELFAWPPP